MRVPIAIAIVITNPITIVIYESANRNHYCNHKSDHIIVCTIDFWDPKTSLLLECQLQLPLHSQIHTIHSSRVTFRSQKALRPTRGDSQAQLP